MNKEKVTSISLGIIGAIMAFTIAMILLQPVQAAPPAAPTPVANLYQSNEGRAVTFQSATALTADTNTRSVEVMNFDSVDFQLTVDHGTVNTTTFTIQYSNDGTNWDDGLALLTNNATDVTEITRVPVFGRYMRVKQDLTNANALTVTLLAVGR